MALLYIYFVAFPASYGDTYFMLPAPSCGRILKLVGLLLMLQYTSQTAGNLPFPFPNVLLELRTVVSFSNAVARFLWVLPATPKLTLLLPQECA